VVRIVVAVAGGDGPKDAVLLQRAEIDADVLGDRERGVGCNADVGMKRGDDPGFIRLRRNRGQGAEPEGGEEGKDGSGPHRQPVYCQVQRPTSDMTSGTWRSSPTSTTARRRWSMPF